MRTILLLGLILTGCGYYLQGTKNPLKELGVEKIYVKEFKNKSYRPGVEQMFTNAIIREVAKAKAFTLVNNPKEADAILSGEISAADGSIIETKETTLLNGLTQQVGSKYSAAVSCQVSLVSKTGRTIFSQSVSDSKVYPGSILTGNSGATVPLVNESEQRLAFQFLAQQEMATLYQSMINIF